MGSDGKAATGSRNLKTQVREGRVYPVNTCKRGQLQCLNDAWESGGLSKLTGSSDERKRKWSAHGRRGRGTVFASEVKRNRGCCKSTDPVLGQEF